MTFGQSAKTCFAKYASFSGRASRSEYWWFWLFCGVYGIALGLAQVRFFPKDSVQGNPVLLSLLALLAVVLPSVAVGCRRLHDTNKTGWWLLVLPLLPLCLLLAGVIADKVIVGILPDVLAEIPAGTQADSSGFDASVIVVIVGPLLLLMPLLVLLFWLVRPSQPGSNKYGPNPNEVPS